MVILIGIHSYMPTNVHHASTSCFVVQDYAHSHHVTQEQCSDRVFIKFAE